MRQAIFFSKKDRRSPRDRKKKIADRDSDQKNPHLHATSVVTSRTRTQYVIKYRAQKKLPF